MNEFLIWSLKTAAVGMRIKAEGYTDELRDRLHDLHAAFPSTVHEWAGPKTDGTNWTPADLDNLAVIAHEINAGIRARHGA
jgi:hypothetical protein